jgi:hypothetical protein
MTRTEAINTIAANLTEASIVMARLAKKFGFADAAIEPKLKGAGA